MSAALQIAACLALPALLLWAEPRSAAVRAIGPVVLCYAAGIAAAVLGAPIDAAAADGLAGLAIALALPLLLFGADVRGWLRDAPHAVLGFAFAVFAALLWGALAAWLFAPRVPDAAAVAGMFVGTYTGSTANMAAVARALGVPAERFVLVNAADLAVGALWLAALLSVVPRIAARFFRPYPDRPRPRPPAPPPPVRGARLAGPLLAAACVGVGLALAALAGPARADAAALLGLSAAATALSFIPAVRALPGTAALGRYGLLVFCTAVGTLTDLAAVLADELILVAMAAVVMFGAIATHFALCRLAGLDRDTAIITGAAAIMGPPLIPPIVDALGNRDVLLSGISTALVGLVVGTWLGVGLAWLLG